ncbi:MAG TPA: GTP 3',8-cyclase MoaA [Methanosarcinaceae archaeon]|nr:GTP 3',8-cyclase MoaA [Methanosarcinaceae archaeon]
MNSPLVAQTSDSLTDPFGRTVTSLRISITNRCNYDCIYCHHEGDTDSKGEIPVETISNIVHAASGMGVDKVKFSGGEPFMRKDFEDILSSLPKLRDVSATTNGTFLKGRAQDLKDAGLDRVNISLDSLDPQMYRFITNSNSNALNIVLDGIHNAVDAGLTPVKLNMVLLKGINDNEIYEMLDFTRTYNGQVILQLIELMDFNDVSRYQIDVNSVEKDLRSHADEIRVRTMHRRKKYIIDGAEVELVRPVDNSEFCANCNRLRVTADGKLKGCLLVNDDLIDVSSTPPEDMPGMLKLAVSRRVPYCRN